LILIGGVLYLNQVVVPTIPTPFIPTPTPTRSPESFITEAEALYKAGKLHQSIQAYQQAILADPSNPLLYVDLARVQVFAGEYEAALTSAENALMLNPDLGMAHAVRAWALDFLGDYLEAEAAIKRALELDPNNPIIHAYYAEILVDLGSYVQAGEESRLALSLGPNLLESHRARGYVLWFTGNWEEAIQEYKTALAINVHMALGYNYRALNEFDQAVIAFLDATALNPEDPTPYTEISRTYATIGEFGKAVQFAQQALKYQPTNPRLHGNLGVMYYKNNQLPEAIRHLALAVRGGTTEEGEVVEGLPLDYGRVAEFYFTYGLALAKSNRCGDALPIFQALLAGVPDDEIARYNAEEGLSLCEAQVTPGSATNETTP
jgi:tetratricopeptide (TPR) repeat protein